MDFSIADLDRRPHGPGRLLPQTRLLAPSPRSGLPQLQDRRLSPRPSPPSRLGPRLPLHRLWPRLQRLHRHSPGGDPPLARRDRTHPSRLRSGRPNGAVGSRTGLRPQAPAGAAPPHAGRRGQVARPQPNGRRGGRGRRCTRTPARRGSSTPIPPTLRGDGHSRRGHGTFTNDRPPVVGMVGRQSGEIRLEVVASAGAEELDEFVDRSCLSGATVKTDDW